MRQCNYYNKTENLGICWLETTKLVSNEAGMKIQHFQKLLGEKGLHFHWTIHVTIASVDSLWLAWSAGKYEGRILGMLFYTASQVASA